MSTTNIIVSALSPIATTLLLAVLYWARHAFFKRLDENKQATLDAQIVTQVTLEETNKKLDIAIEKQALHEVADLALFLAHGERIAWLEGHTGKALGSMAKEDPQ